MHLQAQTGIFTPCSLPAKRAEMEREQDEILIGAETNKKQMTIERDKAQIELEKNRLEAQAKKVLADKEAYERKAVMSADNALSARLATLERIANVNQMPFRNGRPGSRVPSLSTENRMVQLVTAVLISC